MDRRQEFLAEFLGALGAREVRHLQVTPSSISGTVVYDPGDPNEQQAFRWSVGQDNAPSPAAIRLAGLIRSGGLLSIDKLRVSRQDLLGLFNAGQDPGYSTEQFTAVLEELLQIEVPMLDDGVESDCYFIHE
jgi:hypothetical protein